MPRALGVTASRAALGSVLIRLSVPEQTTTYLNLAHQQDDCVPHSSSRNELHDYLVRARPPTTLAGVMAFIATDPAFTLVRQMGPPDEPHTLVVSTSDEGAAALRQRFANELIVERDRPLTLF
jgi:hypothetical protein